MRWKNPLRRYARSPMDKALWTFCLCASMMLPVAASAQQFDYPARLRMEAAVAGLSDPQVADKVAKAAGVVMADVGLSWRAPMEPETPDRVFEPQAGAVIEMVDIRLLLTQIAIQAGARDHNALLRAQGTRDRDVILLRGGSITLPDLFSLSRGTPAEDFVVQTPRGILLTRPLAVWSDAGLALAATDHLILDRPSGSFVVNLGWLDLNNATIVANKGANNGAAEFRPFVLTAGQGGFTAHDAEFGNLGFRNSLVFGGIAIVNNGLIAPEFSSHITDSTMEDVATVALIGTTGAALSGNRISNSDAAAILISNAHGTVVSGNHLTLTGPQAIRVTAGASDVLISDNLVSGTAGMGIMVDRKSRDVTVIGNLVVGSMTTGIAVTGATCVLLVDNLVANNGGAGINLTNIDEATAANNAILFNHGSGILLRDQAQDALIRVGGNVLIANRDGLRGVAPGNVLLSGNDMNGQMPHVFAGDLAPLTVDWLRQRRHAVPTSFQSPTRADCAVKGSG